MTFYILTLFPQVFTHVFSESIIKRAQSRKLVNIKLINIRDFARDKHKTVDDKPYGGGAGMVMKVDTIVSALESIKHKPYSVLLSASGAIYDQQKAKAYSKRKSLALVCGHYEGVDARCEKFVDEVISIGDFILTGGEIAAMAIVDSVTRIIPSVIDPESLKSESFSILEPSTSPTRWASLEYPQFTRPKDFRGFKVPEVLLKGNHQKIITWRQKEAIKKTKKFRPDLFRAKKQRPSNRV